MNLNKPLKINNACEIIDASGAIVVPSITWMVDKYHFEKQKELGELICKLLNSYEDVEEKQESIIEKVETVIKRRGRPPKK